MNRSKTLFFWLVVLCWSLSSCTTRVHVPKRTSAEGGQVDADTARSGWASVLRNHVDAQGHIDFAGVAEDPSYLESYIAWLADADLLSDPEAHLAELINAYNALALYNVVRNEIPQQLGNQLASFFALTKFEIGGESMSLRALENDVIRELGDPRIHFALNCMVRDCPRLPREPFSQESLDAQLDAAAREFFARPGNVRVDEAAGTVHFNEILRFYTGDFLVRAPSLIAYANRYRAEAIPEGLEVNFIDYNWTVNRSLR